MTPELQRLTRRAMNLSLAVGFILLVVKVTAYLLTQSAGILSDAAESVVHVFAVGFAAYSLRLSRKPADSAHLYGHEKIGFFSAGFEGALIIIAALYIFYEALQAILFGPELQRLGIGILITLLVMIVNGSLGLYLIRIGKRSNSIILTANGKHVLTDSWTSAGVLLGLLLTALTGWLYWDALCAILVAINITVSGFRLIRKSVAGLMDVADPAIQKTLADIMDREAHEHHIDYHHLRHRNLGHAIAVDVHLLFPDAMSVRDAHRIATHIETSLARALPTGAQVTSHLEPLIDHHLIHPDPGVSP
ncbi:MAG TPA: cation diffusion facilitator family transporter [Kiritimatiellia bacterium]|nr:cation diffusion facilitator family transporter [Kiritimatiellia bacterium]